MTVNHDISPKTILIQYDLFNVSCTSKEFCPFRCSDLQYRNGQDFWDTKKWVNTSIYVKKGRQHSYKLDQKQLYVESKLFNLYFYYMMTCGQN